MDLPTLSTVILRYPEMEMGFLTVLSFFHVDQHGLYHMATSEKQIRRPMMGGMLAAMLASSHRLVDVIGQGPWLAWLFSTPQKDLIAYKSFLEVDWAMLATPMDDDVPERKYWSL